MRGTLTFSFVVAALTVFAVSGGAQNVQDLTGHEPTSDELIKVLKPREGTHRTRGIGIAPAAAKPQCVQRARSRGIAPVSDMAAIKVLFAFNSAELSPEATHTLDELGKALTSSDLKSYCFMVEGYTDNVGSDAYNLKLSERRAQSVVRYLKERFKIEEDRLQATGYGKRKPIADNSTDEGRQKNRRVQVANLGG
jgi:OOP family OmpA-OmpF porin